jgi:probable F420-dependent oxidoreductase
LKLDLHLPPEVVEEAPVIARNSEELGFDGVWVSETSHDPFLKLALIAAQTDRLTLGTAIALAFTRSPVSLAYTSWDLQRLSKGRFVLGLGSQVKGHLVRRFSGEWRPPVSRMREAILLIRSVWRTWQTGTPLNFSGNHYKADLMTPFFSPERISKPEIPIFLAAVNRGMCRLAGEICDGVHIHPLHTPRYLREVLLPTLDEGARKTGRSRAQIEVSVPVFAAVGKTEEERRYALDQLRSRVAFYASTRTYSEILKLHGWEGVGKELYGLSLRGDWAGMAGLISDEMMDEFAVQGRAEEIPGLLKQRYEGIADRVSLYAELDAEQLGAFARAFKG